MALINRISRLFRADVNAVLDQIEEPEQLLRQAIRDMEDELAAAERRVALCAHDVQVLRTRKQELESAAGELDAQLDLCFEAGKHDLAKALIRKKLETGRLGKHLDAKCAARQRYLETQRKQLGENQATLEGLRQKAELFVHPGPADGAGIEVDDVSRIARELAVDDNDVEIAFLREKAARSTS